MARRVKCCSAPFHLFTHGTFARKKQCHALRKPTENSSENKYICLGCFTCSDYRGVLENLTLIYYYFEWKPFLLDKYYIFKCRPSALLRVTSSFINKSNKVYNVSWAGGIRRIFIEFKADEFDATSLRNYTSNFWIGVRS